jgi:hypothetical protein
MIKGLKRIEIKASQLNELYNTVNHLYKIGRITEYMDAEIVYDNNIIRFIHDRNMGRKGAWVVITPISVIYDED